MNLYEVRPGFYLHWPSTVDSKDKLWLSPGGVLDLDDEFTAECAKGQEYKLVVASKDAKPTKVEHARFEALRREHMKLAPQKKVDDTQKTELEATIPKPDNRPKKTEDKKHGPLQSSLSQSHPR